MTVSGATPESWIGLASELAVAPEGVVVRPVPGALAVHHPERRDFHDLNALWATFSPTPADLPWLLETWDREFGGTAVKARILCWEESGAVEPADSPWATGESHEDFRLSRLEVLRCEAPQRIERAPGLEVRPVEGDEDWRAVVDLNLACHGFEEGPRADFCRWMIGSRHRRSCESGRARWWAAWSGGQAIAAAGLYRSESGPSRFQEVVTHREHRRRGACTTLVSTMLESAGTRGSLLIAEKGGAAHRIYRRLGFEPVARISELFQRLSD